MKTKSIDMIFNKKSNDRKGWLENYNRKLFRYK